MIIVDSFKKNDEKEKAHVLEYLSRNEKYSLFLYTNLMVEELSSSYYIARSSSGNIVGVAAYFPLFQSCSLFTEDNLVARICVRTLMEHHSIKTFLGIADCGAVAYDEFIKQGKIPEKDPRHVFMEVDPKKFHFFEAEEGTVRPVTEEDIDKIVILHRYLHNEGIETPIQPEERERIRLNPVMFCLEKEGGIACVAVSNGIGKKVFQILGVITHPEYRGKGFAKATCSHLIRYFFEKEHAEKAVLFTEHENVAAIACYRALGFCSTNEYYIANFSDKKTV